MIGAAEAAANLLWELSIAAKKEDKLTNNKTIIKTIFNKIGAAEAAANLLYEFNIAEKKEAKQINNKQADLPKI